MDAIAATPSAAAPSREPLGGPGASAPAEGSEEFGFEMRTEGDKTRRQRSGFWFPISVADMDTMRRNRPDTFSTIFAVWAVLVREAHFKRSLVFTLADGIVADRAFVSRGTVWKIKRALKDLRLLNYRAPKNDTAGNCPTSWILKPSVSWAGEKPDPCSTIRQALVQPLDKPLPIVQGGVSEHTLTSTGVEDSPVESKINSKQTHLAASRVGGGRLGPPPLRAQRGAEEQRSKAVRDSRKSEDFTPTISPDGVEDWSGLFGRGAQS